MLNMLFGAHSGVRYLVLLVALLALAHFAFAWLRHKPWDRMANGLSATFVGLLDLQMLLGVALLLAGFRYYPALTGHLVSMAIAVIAAHGLRVAARRASPDRRKHAFAFAGVLVPLVAIIGGITAIGRALV